MPEAVFWIPFSILLLSVHGDDPTAKPPCLNGSVYEDIFQCCVAFHPEEKSMFNAERVCQEGGGHLVSIHNAFENTIIASILFSNQHKTPVWIGLYRSDNGTFIWTDGHSADFLKWASGEPRLDSVLLDASAGAVWTTANDHSEKAFVCLEPPVSPVITTKPPLPKWDSCPPGWSYLADTNGCYYLLSGSATYTNAKRTCASIGSVLTSVHSSVENYFVAGLATNRCEAWIGAFWDVNAKAWMWEDGTPMNYTMNVHVNETCPRDGCSINLSHMPEAVFWIPFSILLLSVHGDDPTAEPPCLNGSVYEDIFQCCVAFHPEEKSMFNAERVCQEGGGHLVSIHNAFENTIIASILFSNQHKTPVWIGLYRSDNGTFIWTDGHSADFLKWASGEPRLDSVLLDASAGAVWTTANDNSEKAFVCLEPPVRPVITAKPPLPKWDSCPPGWSYLADTNACYLLSGSATYTDAKRTCASIGSVLTSVHSAEENYLVASLAANCREAWIGAFWDAKANGWVWEDGTPMNYTMNVHLNEKCPRDGCSINLGATLAHDFGEWTGIDNSGLACGLCKHVL